jgi:hypothetical protein
MPYANNIGITFNRLNKVSDKILESVRSTSVMKCIVKFNPESKIQMKEDIDRLCQILDVVVDEGSSH